MYGLFLEWIYAGGVCNMTWEIVPTMRSSESKGKLRKNFVPKKAGWRLLVDHVL